MTQAAKRNADDDMALLLNISPGSWAAREAAVWCEEEGRWVADCGDSDNGEANSRFIAGARVGWQHWIGRTQAAEIRLAAAEAEIVRLHETIRSFAPTSP